MSNTSHKVTTCRGDAVNAATVTHWQTARNI